MDEKESLLAARQAIKRGDKLVAKRLLHQILEANPHNEVAWVWLSAIVDNRAEEQECLERVIAINPDNQIALRHLQRLKLRESDQLSSPDGSLPSLVPANKLTHSDESEKKPKHSNGVTRAVIMGALYGAISCWAIYALFLLSEPHTSITDIAEETIWLGIVLGILAAMVGGIVGSLVYRQRTRQAKWSIRGLGVLLVIVVSVVGVAILYSSARPGVKAIFSLIVALLGFFTVSRKRSK